MREEILAIFPEDRQEFWRATAEAWEQVQEIRLRVGQPVLVRRTEGECCLDGQGHFTERQDIAHRVNSEELEAFLGHICHESPYAFEDELRQGFLTVPGGHRIGLAGQVVLEEAGRVRTLKNISYVNIRIAHQIFGAADQVLPLVYKGGELRNTLLVSPPGCGKTTLLRELVRRISDGNPCGRPLHVGVVDERSELAGSFLGKPQNDLGSRTDVLDACPKALGMMMLLRAMAPQVIAVDELGSAEDVAALKTVSACGSRILATVHGNGVRDVELKFPRLFEDRMFDCVLVLGRERGKPVIRQVCGGEEARIAAVGRNYDSERLPWTGDVVSEPIYRKAARSLYSVGDAGAV